MYNAAMGKNDVRVVNFAAAIAEHEDRIADLVLSICARAFGGDNSPANVSSLLKTVGFGCDPMDLFDDSIMRVDLIDERLLSDALSSHKGRFFTVGETERILHIHGYARIPNTSTVRRLDRRKNVRSLPTSLFAREHSVIHRLRGRPLKRELVKTTLRQIDAAKILSLDYHLWHFETMAERMA